MPNKTNVILSAAKDLLRSFSRKRLFQDDRTRQSGNAVLFILIAVALFGALSYTFMRGNKSGQGNLTSNQARIAAQELLAFFNAVEKAANKLRARGCSESDISFANSVDTGPFITGNDSASAPVDKSCHVFDSAGAGLNMNMDWTKYQIPLASIPVPYQSQYANVRFNGDYAAIVSLGTNTTELSMAINWVKPEICDAYNQILGQTIDKVTVENDTALPYTYGDTNLSLVGKYNFCHHNSGVDIDQIMYVWLAR